MDTISKGKDRGTGVERHFEVDLESIFDWLFPQTRKSDEVLILYRLTNIILLLLMHIRKSNQSSRKLSYLRTPTLFLPLILLTELLNESLFYFLL